MINLAVGEMTYGVTVMKRLVIFGEKYWWLIGLIVLIGIGN